MEIHYLDNSATTKPCAGAVEAANIAMTRHFANPSSLYALGMDAENMVEHTRSVAADFLNARPDEIIFTSCGSESNNTAIFGAAQMRQKQGRHIVTTAVEHPSVLNCMKSLESKGFEVTYLAPNQNGTVSAEQFFGALRPDTILVSCMAVNNETGAIFPIEQLRSVLKKANSNALIHIDAVQAFGKIKLDLSQLDIDFLSASAHKIHGLKGSGLLYVKKGLNLPTFLFGGGQEKGRRSGTEAVPNIAAFGAAIENLPPIPDTLEKVAGLRQYAIEQLSQFSNVVINSPEDGCPYILNFSFMGYRSETLLHALEYAAVYVSSGSACSKGKGSYVLLAAGLDAKRVDSALRISFSKDSTKQDIDALCAALKQASRLVHR